MNTNSVPSDFKGYNQRALDRYVFSDFRNGGLDLFTDPASANPNKFQQLVNVLPSTSGALLNRWGMQGTKVLGGISPERFFQYQVREDTSFAGTEDTFLLLSSNATAITQIISEVNGFCNYNLNAFSLTPYGVTSREWFYACDGTSQPQKINYSQRSINTRANWGINAPQVFAFQALPGYGQGWTSTPTVVFSGGGAGSGAAATAIMFTQFVQAITVTNQGTGYTSTPTVTISGGGGSSAHGTAVVIGGVVQAVWVSAYGNGYTSVPTVTITGGGGSGATATAVLSPLLLESIQITNVGTGYTTPPTVALSGGGGAVSGLVANMFPYGAGLYNVASVDIFGPMQILSGRGYTITQGSSVNGHYSDTSNQFSTSYQFVNTSLDAGYGEIAITFTVNVSDPQVDSITLLATADGKNFEYQYFLHTFSVSGVGVYTFTYVDTTPDTSGAYYVTGPTLLSNDLWVDVDSNGNPIGVANNEAPPPTINYPIASLGRLFATDGKSVYYSKSIDEVTTSTGLITSKWEEAWPASNELDLGVNNLTITGLLAVNGNIYVGTDQNVILLTGTDAASFQAEVVFNSAGVSSQDVWTLMYKENVPLGMLWITPDYKVIFSDFNSYSNVGLPVFPILNNANLAQANISLTSISIGPYSFVAVNLNLTGTPTPNMLLLLDTEGKGWYTWTPTPTSEPWQFGCQTQYTDMNGDIHYYIHLTNGTYNYVMEFIPGQMADDPYNAFTGGIVPWTIQTNWLNFGDATAYKILNEIEVWSNDIRAMVTVQSALTSNGFSAPTLVKTGFITLSPLGDYKLYLAGSPSKGRYYTFTFQSNPAGLTQLLPACLEQFTVECFTMTRL